MDNFVDERDHGILDNDRYTFAVLNRIIEGKCQLLLTDHESLIICQTDGEHYPVWIWTPDNITDKEKDMIYRLIQEKCPIGKGMKYNLKYDPAKYFIERASDEGLKVKVFCNMFAYDCPKSIEPTIVSEGHPYLCSEKDIDEAASIYKLLHDELGAPGDDGYYRETAKNIILSNRLYFWKNNDGKTVASCGYMIGEKICSITGVYTHKDQRRKHFAQNLVYHVTREIEKTGNIPMLYTDADYAASNSCYTKLGYVMRGKLCTIGI